MITVVMGLEGLLVAIIGRATNATLLFQLNEGTHDVAIILLKQPVKPQMAAYAMAAEGYRRKPTAACLAGVNQEYEKETDMAGYVTKLAGHV